MDALAIIQFTSAIGSTAAYRNHDLEPVAVSQRRLRKAAARHNFAIAFHRYALACKLQPFEQGGNIGVWLKALGGAVDVDFDHFRNLGAGTDSSALGPR